MFTGMDSFDPRRHPRGLNGRFTPAPPPDDPDAGLAADLADPRPDPGQATGLPENLGDRVDVAGNTSTPTGTLTVLADDPDDGVRVRVERNPNTPPETLAALAAGPSLLVQWQVALNPNTPPAVLARLADVPDGNVRLGVANNLSTPPETLARLADDTNPDVRVLAEAGLPDTPPDRVAQLARHGDQMVRIRVARREGLPAGVLAELAGDDHGRVSEAARSNPGFSAPGVAAHAGLLAD